MLARYARGLLIAELALYGVLAAWLIALGLGWPAALAAIVAIALAARTGGVALTFILAEALAGDDERSPPPALATVYSSDDNIVVPRDSAALGAAQNVRLSGIGHVSLAFSRVSRERVLQEIRACEPV